MKWFKSKKAADEVAYKEYRRVYNRTLRVAEADYYQRQFDTKTNTIKQLWANLNKIYSLSKSSCKNTTSKITDSNKILTSAKDISNCFNNYFCSVGSKLSAAIKCSDNEYLKYCDKPTANSMY